MAGHRRPAGRFQFAPRAGAWIETKLWRGMSIMFMVAPRAGAWIETWLERILPAHQRSPPARGRGLKPAPPGSSACNPRPRAGGDR